MFLQDVEEHKGDEDLMFASYDVVSEQIVYDHPTQVVIDKHFSGEVVEITNPAERDRWTEDSDPFGRSERAVAVSRENLDPRRAILSDGIDPQSEDAAKFVMTECPRYVPKKLRKKKGGLLGLMTACATIKRSNPEEDEEKDDEDEGNRSNLVSVVATPDHQLYCARAPVTPGGAINWGHGANNRGLYDQMILCPATRLCQLEDDTAIRMIAIAEGGVHVPHNSSTAALIQTLLEAVSGPTMSEQIAFVEVFGFWLGDGFLEFKDGKPRCIAFSQHKPHDIQFITERLERLGVEYQSSSMDTGAGYDGTYMMHNIEVTDPRWMAFYFLEYEHKYKCSKNYKKPRYTLELDHVQPQYDKDWYDNGSTDDEEEDQAMETESHDTTDEGLVRTVQTIRAIVDGSFRFGDNLDFDNNVDQDSVDTYGRVPMVPTKPSTDVVDMQVDRVTTLFGLSRSRETPDLADRGDLNDNSQEESESSAAGSKMTDTDYEANQIYLRPTAEQKLEPPPSPTMSSVTATSRKLSDDTNLDHGRALSVW